MIGMPAGVSENSKSNFPMSTVETYVAIGSVSSQTWVAGSYSRSRS
jgi:hypothetical protein